MKKIQIKHSGISCLDFLKTNAVGLYGHNIFISNGLFQEMWDECLNKNGVVNIKQPETLSKKNPCGIYQFSYTDNDIYGIPFDTKINIINYGVAKQDKQLAVLNIRTKNLKLDYDNSILTAKVFLTRDKIKKSFLGMEL